MVRKLTLVLSLAVLSLGAAAQAPAPAAAPALTLDQIVAKNIQARGGLDKLKAVKSMRWTAKLMVQGMEIPITMEFKRPNNARMDITLQGMTQTMAYDGKSGWSVNPFGGGSKDPQPMGEDEMKQMEEQADFDGYFVDSQQKGYKLELVGKEPVEGSEAYKIKVTSKTGDVHNVYIDADSFLDVKSESKRTIRGTEQEGEALVSDYKEVDGLMFPFSIDAGQKGGQGRQKIVIEKIELNPTIDDARFKMPAAPKPETPPVKSPGF